MSREKLRERKSYYLERGEDAPAFSFTSATFARGERKGRRREGEIYIKHTHREYKIIPSAYKHMTQVCMIIRHVY